MSHSSLPSCWVSSKKLTAFFSAAAAVVITAVVATAADAQSTSSSWQVAAAIGAATPTTVFKGTAAPEVALSAALFAQVSASKETTPNVFGGVLVRAQRATLNASENDVQWDAGSVSEFTLLATLSRSRSGNSANILMSMRAGASMHTGANLSEPFIDASAPALVGEVGIAIEPHALAFSRASFAITADVNVTRLRMNENALATDGTFSRILIGVQVTR